jgi:hypothetical protein
MPSKNSSNINHHSKRAVLAGCNRQTGDAKCSSLILNGILNTQVSVDSSSNIVGSSSTCVEVESVSLVQNSGVYVYLFTFPSDIPYDEYNVVGLNSYINFSISDNPSSTFPFSLTEYDDKQHGSPVLSESSITSETNNIYTINPGTYNVTFSYSSSSVPMCSSLTFSQVTWNNDGTPNQTITITTSN